MDELEYKIIHELNSLEKTLRDIHDKLSQEDATEDKRVEELEKLVLVTREIEDLHSQLSSIRIKGECRCILAGNPILRKIFGKWKPTFVKRYFETIDLYTCKLCSGYLIRHAQVDNSKTV